jgi:hypothetical protein
MDKRSTLNNPLYKHLPNRVLEHESFEYHKAACLSYTTNLNHLLNRVPELNRLGFTCNRYL